MPEVKRTRRHFQDRVSKYDDPNDLIAEVKGDRFREYRRIFEASGRGELTLDFPVDLSIESVDFCNYACPYCPRVDDAGSRARLPEDNFRKLVDEFAERTGGLGAIGFDRGEPLVDKHLEHKVQYINDKGIVDIIITTNATYLSPERSRRLIEAGVTKMHVSIDAATQETYTKTRGGNLAAVEANLRRFLQIRDEMGRRIPIVRVSFVVCDLNRHEIPLFEAKWAAVADYVEFQDCVDHSRIDSLPDYDVEPFWCQYPFQSVAITAKGEILPCCSFYAKHLVYGSVLQGDTIGGVFMGKATAELRRAFRERRDYDVVCKNCRCPPPAGSGIAPKPLLQPVAGKPRGRI